MEPLLTLIFRILPILYSETLFISLNIVEFLYFERSFENIWTLSAIN